MPDDPPNPPPRPPVPLWLWLFCSLGPLLFAGVLYLETEPANAPYRGEDRVTAALFGVILSVGLTSGFALSCRFYAGWAARTVGTVVFGFLMMIATAAVLFVGCMCTNNIHIHD